MRRAEERYARVGRAAAGADILRLGYLIQCDGLRRHAAQKDQGRARLRAVRQHIRPLSDIKSAATGRQRCNLSALVAKTDTHSPIGERPHHITQQRCFPAARRGEDQCGGKRTCAESLPDPFYLSRNTDTHRKEIVPIPKAALAARKPPAESNTDTALRRNEAAAPTVRRRIGGCAARKLQNAGEIGRRYGGRITKRTFSVRQSYRRKSSAAEPTFHYF